MRNFFIKDRKIVSHPEKKMACGPYLGEAVNVCSDWPEATPREWSKWMPIEQ